MTDELVLVTGATGKTGRSLTRQLTAAGIDHRPASRTSATPFDWTEPATWRPALVGVTAVYLIAPPTVPDPYDRVIDFLEVGETDERRFVFLGMSSLPAGDLAHGRVHQWLSEHANDWAVLRPSAFMQNFSEGPFHASIVEEDTIYSNTGTGRVGFIDANDIARAALHALTAPGPLNRDYVLTGDQALTFAQVADTISSTIGRTITHVHITDDELAERFQQRGVPELTAQLLALAYSTIAQGTEDYTTTHLRDLIGHPATPLQDFVDASSDAWHRT